MTLEGWVFMICSITFVVGLTGWCYWRVLTHPVSADHMHAPLDIETKDEV